MLSLILWEMLLVIVQSFGQELCVGQAAAANPPKCFSASAWRQRGGEETEARNVYF